MSYGAFGLSSNSEGLKRPISRLKAIKLLPHWLGIGLAYFFLFLWVWDSVSSIKTIVSTVYLSLIICQKLFLGALYTLYLAPKNNVLKWPQFTNVI